MSKKFTDPKAVQALNQMKYEIAQDLGMNAPWKENKGTILQSGQNIFFAGHVGGNMTRRLVEMGEKQLLNQYPPKE